MQVSPAAGGTAPSCPVQCLPRRYKGAACGSFAVDLDMRNAFTTILNALDAGVLIGMYKEHPTYSEQFPLGAPRLVAVLRPSLWTQAEGGA